MGHPAKLRLLFPSSQSSAVFVPDLSRVDDDFEWVGILLLLPQACLLLYLSKQDCGVMGESVPKKGAVLHDSNLSHL
jgi:hypothetical protein